MCLSRTKAYSVISNCATAFQRSAILDVVSVGRINPNQVLRIMESVKNVEDKPVKKWCKKCKTCTYGIEWCACGQKKKKVTLSA